MKYIYSLAELEQLDALHRNAVIAKRASDLADKDKSLAPNVVSFTLRRRYQIASRELADFVRNLKQQEAK